MSFYVVDQGVRINMPLASLVRGRQVEAVDATAALAPVRPHSEEVATESTRVAREYQRHQRPPRRPAVFAEQLMSAPARVLPATASAGEGWRLMQAHRFHHLPLVDAEQRLVGIVSDRDLLRAGIAASGGEAVARRPLSELMTARVVLAAPEAEVRAVAEVMVAQHIGAVPVVDAEHRVLGLVSRADILQALVAGAPLELWV